MKIIFNYNKWSSTPHIFIISILNFFYFKQKYETSVSQSRGYRSIADDRINKSGGR